MTGLGPAAYLFGLAPEVRSKLAELAFMAAGMADDDRAVVLGVFEHMADVVLATGEQQRIDEAQGPLGFCYSAAQLLLAVGAAEAETPETSDPASGQVS